MYTPRCRGHDPFLEPNVPEAAPESSVKWAQWNIRVTDPSDFHWSLLEDKAFNAHLAQVQQDRASKEAPVLRGKGVKCKNTASKGGSAPKAKKPQAATKGGTSALQLLMNEARLGDDEGGDPELLGLTGGLLDTPLSADMKEDVDVLLGSICSFQLQALYEMGSVRMVDRALAEGFTAEFMRLSRVVTEDLSKSLCNHHEWVQEGASDLKAFMYKLTSHPLLVKHSDEVTATVEKFKQTAAMNLLLPLLHLDSARSDIARFMNSHLKEVCAKEESKVLIEALTEHLTNLQSQTWRLARSSKLSDPEVATRVMIALLGTQPLVVNYHSGMLDGVAGRLGLTPPGMMEFTRFPSEGMLRRFMNDLECSIKADDSGKPMGWSIQGGLHTEYSSNFMQRNRGEIHCVFCDNLLPNLIKDLDALRLSEPASSPHPRGRLDCEQLIEQFKEMRVEGRKTLFSTLVDCAKGFLTAEDRDQMANLKRPDPTPLPPVTSTTTPVVTTIGDMPLNAVPQLPVTTTPVSLPVTTIAAVVTTVITPVMTTIPTAVITTAITPVIPAVPVNIMPQGGAVSSTQETVTPVGEATEAITTVTVSEVLVTTQASSTVSFSAIPSMPGTFPLNSQG